MHDGVTMSRYAPQAASAVIASSLAHASVSAGTLRRKHAGNIARQVDTEKYSSMQAIHLELRRRQAFGAFT